MKKIISLLLAVMLVVSVLSVSAVVADASGKVSVIADGVAFEATKGTEFEYTFFLKTGGTIESLDATTHFDTAGLKLVPYLDDDDEPDDAQFFPNLQKGSLTTNYSQAGKIIFNFTTTKPVKFNASNLKDSANLVVKAKFQVTAESGSFAIHTDFLTLADGSGTKLCFKGEKLGSYDTGSDTGLSGSTNPTSAPTQTPNPTSAPSTEQSGSGKVTVIADGTSYQVSKGTTFVYSFYLYTGGKVGSLDASTLFDTKGLQLVKVYDSDGDIDDSKYFPRLTNGSLVTNFGQAGRINFNFSSTKGLKFNASPLKSADNLVITASFTVTASEGTFEVKTVPLVIADENDNKLCYKGEKLGTYDTGAAVENAGSPSDPTVTPQPTSAPVTEPTEAPGPAPSKKVTIIADGNTFEVTKGTEFEYAYYLYTGGKVGSLDAITDFDTAGLKLMPYLDDDGDPDDAQYFPNLKGGSLVTNHNKDGQIKFNFTSTKGIKFNAQPIKSAANIVVTAKFLVTAEEGSYVIKTSPVTIADENDNKLCFKGEKVGEYDTLGDTKVTFAPVDPTEAPTQKPTQAPTQKPTQKPTQAPTQKPTQKPTQAPTQKPTQKPTQAPTQKPTQAPTQKPTQAPTQKPTQPPTQPAVSGLYVVADGKAYEVKKNEEFTYTFYLKTGGKVGSLDASTKYDTKGLKLVPFLDDDGDPDDAKYFPNLTNGSLVTNFNKAGSIIFNYSSTKGVSFSAAKLESAKNIVVTAKFKVTADKGIYEINTIPTLIADDKDNKLCFNGEKLGNYDTSSTTGKTPVEMPTEPAGKTFILGDVDGDGKVKILDSTTLQRKLASIPVGSYNADAADVDGSGKVNVVDATYIQRFLASISTPYPIGEVVTK